MFNMFKINLCFISKVWKLEKTKKKIKGTQHQLCGYNFCRSYLYSFVSCFLKVNIIASVFSHVILHFLSNLKK